MAKWATRLEDLRERRRLARLAALVLLASAIGFAVLATLHLETGGGAAFRDVHVPKGWLASLAGAPLSAGDPHPPGGTLTVLVGILQLVVFSGGQLAAFAAAAYAVKMKHRTVVLGLLLVFLLLSSFAPVPKIMAPGVAQAVSVSSAQTLLDMPPAPARGVMQLAPEVEAQAREYVRAQLAYIGGDSAKAASLAERLDERALAAPIHAPYRLQFLQGRPHTVTTVCFVRLGCLTEAERKGRFTIFAALMFAALSLFLVCLAFWMLWSERLTRIDRLGAVRARLLGVDRNDVLMPT